MKFIHTADWQLGMTRHFLSDEDQARFSGARLDAVRQIGSLAVREDCELVVVCGDVFESNQVERRLLSRAFEAMAATPSVAFYLLPGNHDPLDAASLYRSATFIENQPANVVVLNGEAPVTAVEGVELIGAPWHSKRPLTDLVAEACAGLVPSDTLRIAVGHGQVDVLSPDPDNPALVTTSSLERKIDDGALHYVALGDRHSKTDVGRTGRIWYSGAPEPTDYTEIDPGHVLVVELEADRIEVLSHRIGTWSFVRRDWELSADADIDTMDEWLTSLEDKDRTVVKVSLTGQVSVAQKAKLDSVIDRHSQVFAALETWERRSDLAVVPDDADIDDFGLSGFAHEALGDLREQANSNDADRAVAAGDALALLYRLKGARQ